MRIKPLRFFIACVVTLSIAFSLCGQIRINNYDKEWKQVDAFMRKGLPKSALTQVTRIYQLAKKDKQEAQVIKSLIYITGLRNEVTENDTKVIADLEKETTTATESAKSILNSLLAELYWQYFQQHRWQLYNRTNTEAFRQEDIATWTADDLHKKIGELYLRSIKNSSFLQQAKLTPYDAIISKGNVRHLRPTLFDLLAHRALDYFKNDERNITKPAYAFEINQPSAFDPAADFIHHKFETKDSLSLQQKALLLYQQLISFHLNDAKPDALIDVDIERIEFVNEKGVQENKKELYLLALNHITHQYENIPAASQASYLVAAQYNEDANSYQPYGDTLHRYDRVKAKEICEKILSQNDSSEGKINCYNLLNEINKKDLQFSIEKVNIPGQPFRALIQYKNTSQLYLRLVKADGSLKNEPGYYYEDKFWNRLTTAVPVRSWDQGLPGAGDFQKHSAEIKINALPAGSYFLLASTEKNFSVKNSLLGARRFYVSNISFINNGPDYFLLHRETGQPLVNASVQVWEEQYDYKTSKSKNVRFGSYNANELGFFSIELPKEQPYGSHEFQLDISYGGEHLFMSDNLSNYYYYPGGKTDNNAGTFTFLFTDRSIYRPGQTMFFKGLVINRSKRDRKDDIRTTFETMIYLRNANHELIDSLKVTTNDYGSFSGRFQLPQSGLNGEYTLLIRDGQGSANISVEEYKRPKFYVDYENLKETYKVNDKIKVTGFAKAYAGNNIDNATVVYRVVRQPRFIYDWLFWRWWQPPTREMEIVHGEIKTGTDGKFEIEFAAIPDLTIDKKFDPVFDYRIYADVTDINGETRSGESLVSVSYKSLLLEVIVPEKLPVDTLKNITISTTNMAGEFQPASVTVTISKLKEETRLIRARFWQRPDQFVMSKEEYIKLFPYDEYDNETDRKSWAKEKQVFEKTDSSRKNTAFTIKNTEWVAGYYLIEVTTKDKDGQEVKNVKYVELYDDKSNKLERPAYLWTDGSKPIEPGEKTTVRVGTSAENIYLIQQTDRSDWDNEPQTANYKQETLNNEKKTFEFSATESDRGGYGVNYFFVKNNRFYQFADVIKVPWTNKDLKIEYATFREKTLPGSEEKWKVKITGYKNEKVAAEMLASMYDASLDQFRSHNWYNPSLWPTYLDHLRWIGNYNFASIESDQSTPGNAANKLLFKEYDRIVSALYYNNSFSMGYGNSPYYNPYNGIVVREAEISANAAADTVALTSVNDPSKVIQYKVVKAGTRKYVDYRNKPDSNVTAHNGTQQAPEVQIRKNFNETAFFFPDLYTDSLGAVEFSFTVPEALTKWKLQTFAQTKDLAIGLSTKEVVTQKQLMVQPNAPRFFREGDRMEFSAKVVNLTDSEFTGQAQLQLFDATTNQSVDGWFQNMFPNQYFTVAAGQSEVVKFPIQIPYLFNKALTWRVVARAGAFSDGEEDAMPVLTNKTLVTETLPLNMKGSGKKNFRFEKLLNSSPIGGGQEGASETLQNYSLSVEYTTNPAWYAIQALPYLMEYPYECAEQTWNRYYANSLAGMIANSSPRIKQIFLQWANSSKASPVGEGLVGALHKNQELKSILLEETPWVMEAKSEEQQKKNIALLFDMVKMSSELNSSIEKLKQMQSSNGGFVWFKGGPDDRYITQYIVTGIGHLKKIKAIGEGQNEKLKGIVIAAIPYLDKKIKEDYDDLIKHKTDLKKYAPGYSDIQYLYMRSFFPEYPIQKASQTAYSYFRKQIQSYWVNQGKYMQGMIALALSRTGDTKTATNILKSLRETSITNDESGMHWENEKAGWFWYQAPIETQALLIEAFTEVKTQNFASQQKSVDDMKIWLLKNKQTNNWHTTKATAEACYALLLQGSQLLSNEPAVEIKLGNTIVSNNASPSEAGTGYFKETIDGNKIDPMMGNISVAVTSNQQLTTGNLSWGAVYWQYFEELDKITTSATPLKLVKKLFVEKNTDRGPVLNPVNENDELRVGDKIKVRIELRVDRDMEYVHMKDMRASCLEPVNVLSQYKWQDGLGYYESTKDASTNFFFSNLRKGTYVFEYPLFVTHAGNFSNGITSIQCMYAPEFTSHSEGIRISVAE